MMSKEVISIENPDEELGFEVYDYSVLDFETADFLMERETNIKKISSIAISEIGKELKQAQERLTGNNQYDGEFEKWFKALGFKKTTVYNYISYHNLLVQQLNDQKLIESLPKRLAYEIGKENVDEDLKNKVLNGEIKSFNEYKELSKALEKETKKLEAFNKKLVQEREKDIKEKELEIKEKELELEDLKKAMEEEKKKSNSPEKSEVYKELKKIKDEKIKELEKKINSLNKVLDTYQKIEDEKKKAKVIDIELTKWVSDTHNVISSVGRKINNIEDRSMLIEPIDYALREMEKYIEKLNGYKKVEEFINVKFSED